MIARATIILFIIAAPVGAQCLAADLTALYSANALEDRYAQGPQRAYYAISTYLFHPDEQAKLADLTLQFPPYAQKDMRNNPMAFYSYGPPPTVVLPLLSLKFLDDLCTAAAWLQVNGYTQETIADYAAMLRYGHAATYPPPMPALGIPANALSDQTVNQLSLKLLNDIRSFIIMHETGHMLDRDYGPPASPAESKSREERADGFALEILRRDGEIPAGMVLYFTVMMHLEPNRGDFASESEWQDYLKDGSHPLTAERIRKIGQTLNDNAASFARNETDQSAGIARVHAIAIMVQQFATDFENPDQERLIRIIGEKTTPATLKPRAPASDPG
jgi:hypothetical protein